VNGTKTKTYGPIRGENNRGGDETAVEGKTIVGEQGEGEWRER
jgi:hypothetical protein